jgi:hypothetical protein
MAEREIENSTTVLTPEDIEKLSDDQLVAHMVEIAERGMIDIRTNVDLPPEFVGHWVKNTPEDIASARMFGWQVDTKYAASSALHGDGKGNPVIGDVVFMVRSRRVHEAFEKAQAARVKAVHGVAKNLQEEKDFEGNIKSTGLGVKYRGAPINTSINERVTAGQISSMIAAQNNGES